MHMQNSNTKMIQKRFMSTLKQQSRLYTALAIFCGVVFLILVYNPVDLRNTALAAYDPPPYPDPDQVSAHSMALTYLNEQPIQHSGLLKGGTTQEESRTIAIHAFNDQNYLGAEKYFEEITSKSEEDRFCFGVAALYNAHYQKAINVLTPLAEEESRFSTECNWYLALAHLLQHQEEQANQYLIRVEQGTWNAEQARKLLQKLTLNQ